MMPAAITAIFFRFWEDKSDVIFSFIFDIGMQRWALF
jgi:hypothetical protein